MRSPRLVPSLLAVAAVVALAAGCSTTPQSPAPTSTGSSTTDATGSTAPEDRDADDIEVAWLDGGRSMAIVTWGSSSRACQPSAGDATADGQVIAVTLADPSDEESVCTADLGPRAALVNVPEGMDVTRDVEVRVTYGDISDDADLDGLAEPAAPGLSFGEEPSAGWFDDRGIVLLTYGSSSCQPVVEDVEQTADGATVTFAEIDGVCTMDMAPRLTVLTLPQEHDDDAPFRLTMIDGEFESTVDVIG
ncbi:hypothetical protein [Microbacterium sp. NPDC058345]|uniref:hypothetical protein n=1 Tax=Microbacterium sp. NPDC058345 TaxID=3346455 RepID=UPI00365D8003